MTNKEAFTKFFHNPTFKDAHCKNCNMLVPCTDCSWWDEEYTGSEEEEYTGSEEKKPPFKIFISQPMKGRTDEEIMQERNRIMAKWANKSVEFINSFFCEPGKNSTDSLGKSISLMGEADLVVFAPGWADARGCSIEHEVAMEYGIQISYFV